MGRGTIESLEAISSVFTMFAEDDKHDLRAAAEAAKTARNKSIEAALEFRKAADLLGSYAPRKDIADHLSKLDTSALLKDWEARGIIRKFGRDIGAEYEDATALASGSQLAALVGGYGAKYEVLAEYLAWPVDNLLSNRYAFRDDMLRIFALVGLITHDGAFLSQLLYELPSQTRSDHEKWLDSISSK